MIKVAWCKTGLSPNWLRGLPVEGDGDTGDVLWDSEAKAKFFSSHKDDFMRII